MWQLPVLVKTKPADVVYDVLSASRGRQGAWLRAVRRIKVLTTALASIGSERSQEAPPEPEPVDFGALVATPEQLATVVQAMKDVPELVPAEPKSAERASSPGSTGR